MTGEFPDLTTTELQVNEYNDNDEIVVKDQVEEGALIDDEIVIEGNSDKKEDILEDEQIDL